MVKSAAGRVRIVIGELRTQFTHLSEDSVTVSWAIYMRSVTTATADSEFHFRCREKSIKSNL